jgi:hypothetical protein
MIGQAASVAIGEFEQTVFDCPSCSRPLALGARRCPGCRTRLVNGVSLGKASVFVAAGLAVGLLVGGGGGVMFGLASSAAAAPAIAAGPSAHPPTGSNGGGTASVSPSATGSPVASAAASAPAATPTATTAPTASVPSGIPPVARSALVQVVGTNDRLALAGAALRSALAAPGFDASAVAQILRSISADSVFGEQLADRVTAWPAARGIGAELKSFYGAVHDAAGDGLVASVRNTAAYRAAASQMLELLDGLAGIDAALRALAGPAGIDLPVAPAVPAAP